MSTALERDEHGVSAYRLGCRCSSCRRAMHRHAKVWWATAQLRKGRDPASYTAAGPVRKRIGELRAAGWTSTRIARAAGVSPGTVSRLRKRSTRWCSRIVAGAVMAIEP